MRKQLKNTIFNFFLIICLISVVVGCETTSQSSNIEIDQDEPDENSKNVEVKKYNGSKLEYLLKARSITRFYDKQSTIADSVYIITVEEGTGIITTVVCDTTIIDDKSNIIRGIGNVVFKYGDVRRVETELAYWDRTKDRIICPGEVDFWDENTYLNGFNLETNSKLEMTRMEKVSGQGVADEKVFNDISNRNKHHNSSE